MSPHDDSVDGESPNMQPFKDNMLAAYGITPAMEKDAALIAALGPCVRFTSRARQLPSS